MTLYCSGSELRAGYRLGQEGSGGDASLEQVLGAASRWIDGYFDLPDGSFAQDTETTRYFSNEALRSGTVLQLDVPIIELNMVTNGDNNEIDLSDIALMPYNESPYSHLRLTAGLWIASYAVPIAVYGLFGYSTVVPDLIREATAMVATWMLDVYQANRTYDSPAYDESGKQINAVPFPNVGTLLQPLYSKLRSLRS